MLKKYGWSVLLSSICSEFVSEIIVAHDNILSKSVCLFVTALTQKLHNIFNVLFSSYSFVVRPQVY